MKYCVWFCSCLCKVCSRVSSYSLCGLSLTLPQTLRAFKTKRQNEVVSIDSDSDEPTPKRAKDDTAIKISRIESKVNYVREDVYAMKEAIKDILHLNEKSKLPMGLQ